MTTFTIPVHLHECSSTILFGKRGGEGRGGERVGRGGERVGVVEGRAMVLTAVCCRAVSECAPSEPEAEREGERESSMQLFTGVQTH